VNEISGRYSVMSEEFYIPERIQKQSKNNKQGSGDFFEKEKAGELRSKIENSCKKSFEIYKYFCQKDSNRRYHLGSDIEESKLLSATTGAGANYINNANNSSSGGSGSGTSNNAGGNVGSGGFG
jgi:hypothetical protein